MAESNHAARPFANTAYSDGSSKGETGARRELFEDAVATFGRGLVWPNCRHLALPNQVATGQQNRLLGLAVGLANQRRCPSRWRASAGFRSHSAERLAQAAL